MTTGQERLRAIRERHEASTQGNWVAIDLGGELSGKPDAHCWWVWREERLPFWGGVLEVDYSASPGDPPGQPIGEAYSTEEADTEFIANAHQDVPDMVDALECVLDIVNENLNSSDLGVRSMALSIKTALTMHLAEPNVSA